jgi:hypothetical protein
MTDDPHAAATAVTMQRLALATVPLPHRMRHLPRTAAGYVVPKFVRWFGDRPDFRIVDTQHYADCLTKKVCWICGGPMGSFKAFLIGPMCAINRTTSEPPAHHDCARYAAQVCPFMINPQRERRETNMPTPNIHVAGTMLPHNPGASALWITRSWKRYRVASAPGVGEGYLIELGPPTSIAWWSRGRQAQPIEVYDAIAMGLPKLVAVAKRDGEDGVREFRNFVRRALPHFPEAIRDAIKECLNDAIAK